MRPLKVVIVIFCMAGLAGACAPEMCPGAVKAKTSRSSLATNPRANQKKAKESLISVTKSSGKHRQQPVIFAAKSTKKRVPPK